MDKNIIIDGVDVAGCKHYKNNGKCRIPHYQQSIKYVSCNCNEWDCDYKQLKCLEQENKALQAYKDINEDFKKAWDELNEKHKRCRSALEKIREINKLCFERKYGYPEDLIEIDDIIREVLQ